MVQVKPDSRPTADELLKLPLFCEFIKIPIRKIPSLSSNVPRKSFPNKMMHTSMSMNLKKFQIQSDSSVEEEKKEQVSRLPKLHSLRNINIIVIPQIQRNCSHYLSLKK